jgi:hypothetical protein
VQGSPLDGPPKLHHVVPRFFLRRFADDDLVSVVSRDGSVPSFTASVDVVLAEKYFYDTDVNGAPNAWWVESMLADLEGRAKPVLDKIDGGVFPPRGDDREILAMFVATALVRGHRFRALLPGVWRALQLGPTPTPADMRAGLRSMFGIEVTDAEVEACVGDVRAVQDGTIPFLPDIGARLTPLAAAAFSRKLLARTWHLLTFGDPVLLTGDAPVALNHDILSREVPLGLNCDEIVLPIDPRNALFLLKETHVDGTTRVGTPELAHRLNATVASQCMKWIVHHPKTKPLAGMPDLGAVADTLVPVTRLASRAN